MLSISDNLHLFTFPDKPNLPEYCFPIPNYLKRIFQFFSLNPNRSLEPKHILFYYREDCLALERRRSGLRQVTKTNKMLIRK